MRVRVGVNPRLLGLALGDDDAPLALRLEDALRLGDLDQVDVRALAQLHGPLERHLVRLRLRLRGRVRLRARLRLRLRVRVRF